MARPRKTGLSFYYKDAHEWDDYRIIDLVDTFGPVGYAVFDVIRSEVYKSGYYLELPLPKLALLVMRAVGNRWIEDKSFVLQVADYCGEIGLFHPALLKKSVITSVEMQRHYADVTARSKADKTRYWLLGTTKKEACPAASFSEPNQSDKTDERIVNNETNETDETDDTNAPVCDDIAETPDSAVESGVSAENSGVFAAKMQQRKEKKSKAKQSKQNQSKSKQSRQKQSKPPSCRPEGDLTNADAAANAAAANASAWDDFANAAAADASAWDDFADIPDLDNSANTGTAASAPDWDHPAYAGTAASAPARDNPANTGAVADASQWDNSANADTDYDDCREIDNVLFAVTGRRLTGDDRQIIAILTEEGIPRRRIEQTIRDVGSRNHGPIHSFRYFVPILREAGRDDNARDGRYPYTYDAEAIEAILTAEQMAVEVGPDEDYIYDD